MSSTREIDGLAGPRARLGRALLGALLLALALAAATPPPAAAADKLRIGVGRADITPPTGYFSFGYVRGDGLIEGAQGRLWARVIVLEQDGQKVALVSEDLAGIIGGVLEDAIDRVSDLGYTPANVLASASHTHGGPTGFANFDTYNTVFMSVNSPTDFQLSGGFDPQLYDFQVTQLAQAIRRADRNLGPGRAGWGSVELQGPTINRSLEAHLRNHDITEPPHQGQISQDPDGPLHTLSTPVDVLRVERRRRGRWLPVGIWTTYANHGTINKYQFRYYNQDHHGPATDFVEERLRARGKIPGRQEVVTVYGNADEGDMSAGLQNDGPAAADRIGKIEGRAMISAWKMAAAALSRRIDLDTRWTKVCFCGAQTSEGQVAEEGRIGASQLTGSDEARGPLFDVTRVSQEGVRSPTSNGPQGRKAVVPLDLDVPEAVPVMVVRVADRLIGSVPGEPTSGLGKRIRALLAEAGAADGVERTVVSGLANEYTSYFTTPAEYDAQHYEGGSTLYGTFSSILITDTLSDLADRLIDGRPSPEPFFYDQTNGRSPEAEPYSQGAPSGRPTDPPPIQVERLGDGTFGWRGGERGFDRPLETAFIEVERQRRGDGGWTVIADDLGLEILWFVDEEGNYTMRWEPDLGAATGTHRFRIRANNYGLISPQFEVVPSKQLELVREPAPSGQASFSLHYPEPAVAEEIDDAPPDDGADLNHRPELVRKGKARVIVGDERITVTPNGGRFSFDAPSGSRIEVPPGAARDNRGNRNAKRLVFEA